MIPARQIWPEDFAERYRRLGYWRGETFGALLRARAAADPAHLAVVGGCDRWSYADLDARADALAAGFLRLGLVPGERVLLQLGNEARFLSLVFGLFRAGLLPVFALPAHRRTEIRHLITRAEAAACVVRDTIDGFDHRGLAREMRTLCPGLRHVVVAGDAADCVPLDQLEAEAPRDLPERSPSEVAFLQLSGGSTGLPKLIPRTHDDYIYSLRGSAAICGLGRDSVYLTALPAAHNFPMSSPGSLGTLHAGGTVVMAPSASPEEAFALIARERVTITGLVPPLALLWAEAAPGLPHDLSSLKVLQVGGAKLTPAMARRIVAAFGPRLQQVFGMAEGLVAYTRLDDDPDRVLETQGRPISPDDELLVVDPDDRPVPPGTPGALLTRGPYTIRAYHDDDAANAAAFTPDGFYRTGDVVIMRPDGYLSVQGRLTDRINRGGEKFSPEEVEDHLLAHPQVRDAAVVSVPDPVWGERACAFVLPRDDAPTARALKAWLTERGIAAFKIPDRIVFVAAFPETAVGKTSRRDLREALRKSLATT
ncbi:AMP-binding protein [Rhodoplanes sp. TEM]|uniref:AMP-binding protein n=1 Tax=Rhodoplanes tepidamans TaxID=200616 RepID=A0ABT5JBR2_RHOTP|nr:MULTISPECIES: AMP-binding protein [Rhodoplanes]MDC7787037.1 AMP-binding protein [Rhodoplanes tepidamans]MDC7985265.1 AMP-binding protein [Rhodoplanes sp. TEM]MDQ0354236.1 2,3-dihydroxybenzoate-AMP ligase [Rhodoplanes tepidamans]